jgi:Asp-tRNA(Asn)/Glu-tRNA(Gln) amidotransferase B subunit
LQLVTDPKYLQQICQAVIDAHPDLVYVYRNGGKFVTKMHKRFTGLAMEASQGNAHPERLREILFAALEAAAKVDPATKSV